MTISLPLKSRKLIKIATKIESDKINIRIDLNCKMKSDVSSKFEDTIKFIYPILLNFFIGKSDKYFNKLKYLSLILKSKSIT